MVDEMLDPCVIGVRVRRQSVAPTHIVCDLISTPLLEIEGRIGENEVRALPAEFVIKQAVAEPDVTRQPMNREVHLADPPGRLVQLLSEDRDLLSTSPVGLDELGALNEESA